MSDSLLVCLFHLNLAFSSLEADRREEVVARCYRPLLALPERTGFPVAIEAAGVTLDAIAAIDPDWIAEARRLAGAGKIELVAGGRAQIAAPLVPADVNAWNLRLGLADARRILGVRPRIALLAEQAYSPGLLDLHAEAGFAAVVADWDNAVRSHGDWPAGTERRPRRAAGTTASLPVIWSESIAFQRFQRFAHGELAPEQWLAGVRERAAEGPGVFLLYANDAEVFDHRPGRFAAEPPLGSGEWDRIAAGLRALAAAGPGRPALPTEALARLGPAEDDGPPLRLESPQQPVPVKKQDKYNVARWAVTGRDDIGLNAACHRLLAALRARDERAPAAWRELCELWSSDLRTHITAARWEADSERVACRAADWGAAPPASAPAPPGPGAAPPPGVTIDGPLHRATAGPLDVVLNARRGLAVHALRDLRLGDGPLLGTLEHGYYSAIDLGADWYTGALVQEAPGAAKVADLERTEPVWAALPGGGLRAWATVPTGHGPVEKVVTLDPTGVVELDLTVRWPALPPGSLRLAVTLHPEAFDRSALFYAAHDGGRALERHALGAEPVDHGAPVSALVSSTQGIGMTEGVALLGDARRHIRVEVDQALAAPLGLIAYRPLEDTFFLRLSLSLTEHDDTRRGPIPRPAVAPQRLRVRLRAVAGPPGA